MGMEADESRLECAHGELSASVYADVAGHATLSAKSIEDDPFTVCSSGGSDVETVVGDTGSATTTFFNAM